MQDQQLSKQLNAETSTIRSTVREAYLGRWLIIEALTARTEGKQRLLDRIAVKETFPDGAAAMQRFQRSHGEYPP